MSQEHLVRTTVHFTGENALHLFQAPGAVSPSCLDIFRYYCEVPDKIKVISLCLFLVMVFSLYKSEEQSRVAALNFLIIHLKLDTNQKACQLGTIPGDNCVERRAGREVEGSSDETQMLMSWLFLPSLSENAFHPL